MPPTKKKRSSMGRAPSTAAADRTAILLEDIRDQNRATIEAVLSMRTALEEQIAQQRKELLARIEVLEAAVRSLSQDVRELKTSVAKNSQDIRLILEKLDTKADTSQLAKLEKRVERLEHRVAAL